MLKFIVAFKPCQKIITDESETKDAEKEEGADGNVTDMKAAARDIAAAIKSGRAAKGTFCNHFDTKLGNLALGLFRNTS